MLICCIPAENTLSYIKSIKCCKVVQRTLLLTNNRFKITIKIQYTFYIPMRNTKSRNSEIQSQNKLLKTKQNNNNNNTTNKKKNKN